LKVSYLCYDTAAVYCFSGRSCGSWFITFIRLYWYYDFAVERDLCRCDTSAAWWIRWDLASFGLTDKTGYVGASWRHCSLLHLYYVARSRGSAWSVAQSTTQAHCRETLHFPSRQHSAIQRPSISLRQKSHLAADRLRTIFAVVRYCTK